MKPNYTPHTAQALIHAASKCRFRTVCTGRRFGKTLFLAAELLDRGAHDIAGTYGWVAPTYKVFQGQTWYGSESAVGKARKRAQARWHRCRNSPMQSGNSSGA